MQLKRLTSYLLLTGLATGSYSAFANENQANFEEAMNSLCEPFIIDGPLLDETFNDQIFAEGTLTNVTTRAATVEDVSTECLNFGTTNDLETYLAQATPDEAPALHTSLVQLSSDQISNISQHLVNLRYRQRNSSSDSTAYYPGLDNYYGGAASSDLFSNGRISVFLNGSTVDGEQDSTDYEVGYDLSTDHYTLGVDYRISQEILVGFAYGASETELEYSQFSDLSENDTDHYMLYASWYRDNFAVDATLGFASGEFETLRHLPDANATGKTDNDMTYFSISGAYDFSQGGWTYGPKASLDWLDGEIDAFSESDESAWAASFEKQEIESLILAMGGYVSYAASFNWGVLVPHARAEWRNEFEDDRDLIVGQFVSGSQEQFGITPDDPDTTWFQASIGISAVFAHGISAYLDYEEIISYNDTDLGIFSAGARFEF